MHYCDTTFLSPMRTRRRPTAPVHPISHLPNCLPKFAKFCRARSRLYRSQPTPGRLILILRQNQTYWSSIFFDLFRFSSLTGRHGSSRLVLLFKAEYSARVSRLLREKLCQALRWREKHRSRRNRGAASCSPRPGCRWGSRSQTSLLALGGLAGWGIKSR